MLGFLRNVIVKTPVYPLLRYFNDERLFRSFTADDRRRLAFYETLIRPGELVFDVGANMGNRTKLFLKLGARVVAFEPQTLCANFLQRVLKNAPDFTLIRKALGPEAGEASMLVSNAHTISSLSSDWVQATQSSGRFSMYKWDRTQTVEMTTLDAAIETYGVPVFIKIDVEGFESEVLAGLSRPIPCISVEFTPEYLDNTYQCLDHLAALSPVECQYSLGESMTYALPEWVPVDDMKRRLAEVDAAEFGDVYIRVLRDNDSSASTE